MKKRIFTALVAIPLVLSFFLLDNLLFTHCIFLGFSCILAYELLKLSRYAIDLFSQVFVYTFIFIFCVVNFLNFSAILSTKSLIFFYLSNASLLFLLFFILMMRALFVAKSRDGQEKSFIVVFSNLIYILFVFVMVASVFYHVVLVKYVHLIFLSDSVLAGFFYFLQDTANQFFVNTVFYGLNAGEVYLLYVCLVNWSYDSFAYFFGYLFGRKKLSLAISPQKSYFGLIGGTLFTLLLVMVVYCIQKYSYKEGPFSGNSINVLPLFSNLFTILFVSFILICVAQIGDLFASLLKRVKGVKDSGAIFPGHGGLFDRIDSFLFVVPTFFYLIVWACWGNI